MKTQNAKHMAKETSQWQADFYRNPELGEIGPQLMCVSLFAFSKTQAIKLAKEEARRRYWRFLEVKKGSNGPSFS